MSVWIDIKYINLVGFRLDNFKWVRPNKLANCSCPLCGDSLKDKHKARGYFLIDSTKVIYHCHNCSTCVPLSHFLHVQFPLEYNDYKMEKFQESRGTPEPKKEVELECKPVFAPKEFLAQESVRLSDLPDDHPAVEYIRSRKIVFKDLWYTDHFKELVLKFEPAYAESNMVDEPRIIIPFRNSDGTLAGFQGRALGKSKMRYVTIKRENADIIFGLDRVTFSKTVLVFEGALDATFIPNALAANGSALQRLDKLFTPHQLSKMIFVYDNEPRNPQIVSLLKRMIELGHRVVVWSRETPKDINNMILSGMTKLDIAELIAESVTSGPSGLLKLTKWRKC